MIKQRGGSKLYGAILVIAALVLFSTVSFRSPEETTYKAAAATPSKEEVHKTKQHNGSDASPLDWTDRWEASLPLAGVIPKEPSVIGITVWLGGNVSEPSWRRRRLSHSATRLCATIFGKRQEESGALHDDPFRHRHGTILSWKEGRDEIRWQHQVRMHVERRPLRSHVFQDVQSVGVRRE